MSETWNDEVKNQDMHLPSISMQICQASATLSLYISTAIGRVSISYVAEQYGWSKAVTMQKLGFLPHLLQILYVSCFCKALWTIYFCHFVVNARLILWRAIHPLVVNIIHAYFQYDAGQITKDKWYSTRTWLSKCSYQGIHISASNLSCSECFIWLDLLCLIYIPVSHRANGP